MGLSPISASCIAAIVTRLICHPLDTLRIQSQLSKKQPINPKYYKGLGISLFFSVPGLASYLSTYDYSKNYISTNSNTMNGNTLLLHSISALAAEVVSGLFWTPMEIIKSKQQSGTLTHQSSLQISKQIYFQEGIKGFFRGYLVQMAVFVPYTVFHNYWVSLMAFNTFNSFIFVCYFVVYERLKVKCLDRNMGAWSYILSSGIAGGLASIVSSTADIVKTRMQVNGDRIGHVVHDLWNQHGYRMLFKGMQSRILWIVPSVTISMTVYEKLKE